MRQAGATRRRETSVSVNLCFNENLWLANFQTLYQCHYPWRRQCDDPSLVAIIPFPTGWHRIYE
jgi:hypothetical protein